MTRKDYELIAAAIGQARQATSINRNASKREAGGKAILLSAIGLASHLQQDNPRFDQSRFLKACGYGA